MAADLSALLKQPLSHEWRTPPDLYKTLGTEFRFDLDAAATEENALCSHCYSMSDDALNRDWVGKSVWCNPPYGLGIGKWVRKGFEEAQTGTTVVMLIPARTDTSWWHRYVMCAAEIRLVRGRLRFSGHDMNAPFPSAVVVFRPGEHLPRFRAIERDGSVVAP